jgi:pre-rRNA-processing protein TSR1
MPNHHHRSGGLSQNNKKNKRSKASKRSISRAAGGRVNIKAAASLNLSAETKANRRNQAQQRRDASRQAVIQRRRGMIGGVSPPRVVGIISLARSCAELEDRVRNFALQTADHLFESSNASVTAKYNAHKKDGILTFLTMSSSCCLDGDPVLTAMDIGRFCDVILFVIDGNGTDPDDLGPMGMHVGADAPITKKKTHSTQEWDHLISPTGDRILDALKAQGLPTPITVLAHTAVEEQEDFMTMRSTKSVRRSAIKRRQDLKKYVSRFAETEFGVDNSKVIEIDLNTENSEEDKMDDEDNCASQMQPSSSSSAMLIRTLCNMSASTPKWVSEAQRPFLVADDFSYNSNDCILTLTGYIRGKVPWDVNSLVHIPNVGTFACQGVQRARAPFSSCEVEKCLVLSAPTKREALDTFAKPDALEGEQNLVGFDEGIEEVDDEDDDVLRPAGWSDYQSAWLDGIDDVSHGANEYDYGELAKELNQKKIVDASVSGMDVDDDDISPEERQLLINQRKKNQKEDLEFPDEVEVPDDMKASDRFARYRSLKSFRKSHWDPKESLPEDYASIYHFKSFKATQRDVKADIGVLVAASNSASGHFWGSTPAPLIKDMVDDCSEDEEDVLTGCVPSGTYVSLLIENVHGKAISRLTKQKLLCAVALLSHENKVSVINMGLSQTQSCDPIQDIPVKSKDILMFRCGWRTWKARPVFSQNNLNSDKHKFERFLPQGGAFFAASVYGPVTYTPCPVIVFRERDDVKQREIVAVGSILNADADRIVVKRIVLTGYPVRVHKRHATVKYMFNNPDDVRWFKPAGLYTKHGLNGNIIESSGEHGTMKCLFNAPIKQHDTVCLPLYKRIYPKYENFIPSSQDGATVKSVISNEALLIL